jgi:hypothetical protein
MDQVLQVIEAVGAGKTSAGSIFSGDGAGTASRRKSPLYEQRLTECAKLIGQAFQGSRKAQLQLREAMTTSDFPLIFGDMMDRILYAGYQEATYSWDKYARLRTVKDFKEVGSFTIDGGSAALPQVGEKGEYERTALSESKKKFRAFKFGRSIGLTWEMLLGDDLDAFKEIPQMFGIAARRTEEKFVTELFVDTNGPKADFFSTGNKNLLTGNPDLTVQSLQDALTLLMTQTDADGEPIVIESAVLVVPPTRMAAARNIINATEIRLTEAGGKVNQQLVGPNWAKDIVIPATNFYIPHVAKTANGNTSWFVFADPKSGRPALEVAKLRGHENPEIFMKKPDSERVGGGDDDVSYDDDSRDYKVRHVFGGQAFDPKCAVASNGSGA